MYESYYNLSIASIAVALIIFFAIIIFVIFGDIITKIKILTGAKQKEEYIEFAAIIERENELQSHRRLAANAVVAKRRETDASSQVNTVKRTYAPTTDL